MLELPAATLLDRAALIQRFNLLADRKGFAIAVSGGPDSVALLLMIARWRKFVGYGGDIVVLSVDHGLRPESADEVQLVGEIAAQEGFAFEGLRWAGEKPTSGLAAVARTARYRLLAQRATELGLGALLLGHHCQDQAETVLMRMAHGSGVTGLGGMRKVSRQWGIDVIRPLLDVSKVNLIDIVRCEKVRTVQDTSNSNVAYERVRWRNMLGILAENGLESERLGLMATRMARADDALKFATDAYLKKHVRVDGSGIGELSLLELSEQPQEIGLRVLIALAGYLGGSDVHEGYAALELAQAEMLYTRLAEEPKNAGITLAGARFQWQSGILRIAREAGRTSSKMEDITPGTTVLWDNRFAVRLQKDARGAYQIGRVGVVSRRNLEKIVNRPVPDTRLLHGTACVRSIDAGKENIVAIAGFLAHKEVEISFRHYDVFAADLAL